MTAYRLPRGSLLAPDDRRLTRELLRVVERLRHFPRRRDLHAFVHGLLVGGDAAEAEEFFARLALEICPSPAVNRCLRAFRHYDPLFADSPGAYRAHFLHQFLVWLLGVGVLDASRQAFLDMYRRAYRISKKVSDSAVEKELTEAWLLTALAHDTGMVPEKIEKCVGDYMTEMLGVDYRGGNRIGEAVAAASETGENLTAIAAHMARSLKPEGDAEELRHDLLMPFLTTEDQSHAIFGGLGLARVLRGRAPAGALRCGMAPAAAVALHHWKVWRHLRGDFAGGPGTRALTQDFTLPIENCPLSFLLLMTDYLQGWGRTTAEQALHDDGELPCVPWRISSEMGNLSVVLCPEQTGGSADFERQKALLLRIWGNVRKFLDMGSRGLWSAHVFLETGREERILLFGP